jgi:ATP-binding cassette subfamily C protein CydD
LSVAIVAVGIGLRLVNGSMDLQPALAVLILAPEVYLPVRQVGMHFHASTDGIAAANQAFAVLDEPVPPAGTRTCPPLAGARIVVSGISVRAGDRHTLAPDDLSLTLDLAAGPGGQGRIVALTGPSGVGKTTTSQVLLGLVRPDFGSVRIESADTSLDLDDIDPATYWAQLAWVPQRPPIPPGTLREAVTGGLDVTEQALSRAAGISGLDALIEALPLGWKTPLGLGGHGLSVGQRQRVALTAALLGDPATVPLVILDEPTAHLDAASEQTVIDAVLAWREQGRTVVVVAHRAPLVRIADEVIEVRSRTQVPA